jgi:DNA-binding GntR family transcriptional regulator
LNVDIGAQTNEDKVEKAYQFLRQEIIQGRLKPLESVDQSLVASQLNCSRLPVRQGLLRLSLEGLVTYVPNKGAKVTALSMEDLVEIYSARVALESMLAKTGARKCELGQLLELKKLFEAQQAAVKKQDAPAYLSLDEEFHSVLYKASGYLFTCTMTDQLRQRASRYLYLYASSKDHLEASLQEHSQILDAIQANDYELVGDLVKKHIEQGMEEIALVISGYKL